MSIKFHILSASENLAVYATEIERVAESTTDSVKKLLAIKDVDVVFYDNPGATIDEVGGIGGFTPNQHTIFISFNPRHPNFKSAIKDELSFILAHEFHHTLRWQKTVEGDSLLEALIFEGLAEHFAIEATGRQKPSPWAEALNDTEKKKFLERASKEWLVPTYNNALWFFGSNPKEIPRWTGYTLGFDLVAKYLQTHPETSASKLVFADATLFI